METPTHYELLCVTPEATADEIRAAYRRLIRVFHPDVATEAGQAMTTRLNDAQRELLDPMLRARYDQKLSMFSSVPTRSYSPGAQGGYSQPRYSAQGFGTSSSTSSGQRPPRESSVPFPDVPRQKRVEYTRGSYLRWMTALVLAGTAIVVATGVVFVICYSGTLTLLSPRFVPPMVVGIAWLVAVLRRPSKLLIAFMVIGAGLWPLAAAGVEPFTILNGLAAPTLPCLTLIAVGVVAFRSVAPRADELSRLRPQRPVARAAA